MKFASTALVFSPVASSMLVPVLAYQGCSTHYYRVADLKRNLFPFSSEGQKSNSRCWQSWFLLKPSLLGFYKVIFSTSFYMIFSLCVCDLISSLKRHLQIKAPSMTSFHLNYLFKNFISKHSHIIRYQVQNFNT